MVSTILLDGRSSVKFSCYYFFRLSGTRPLSADAHDLRRGQGLVGELLADAGAVGDGKGAVCRLVVIFAEAVLCDFITVLAAGFW